MRSQPLVPLVLMLLVGCGGGGSSVSSTTHPSAGVNAFAGAWSGGYGRSVPTVTATENTAGSLALTLSGPATGPGGEPGLAISGTVVDVKKGGGTVSGFVAGQQSNTSTGYSSTLTLTFADGSEPVFSGEISGGANGFTGTFLDDDSNGFILSVLPAPASP